MRIELTACAVLASVALVSCGRPDASGIYVLRSDREVVLVQLVQTKEGVLTGRIEDVRVDSEGRVRDKSMNIEGAVSGRDLMLKPTKEWSGGVGSTGQFDRASLTLTAGGSSLKAERSSLKKYEAAVAHLRSVASDDRQRIAAEKAKQAVEAAKAEAAKQEAKRAEALEQATIELRDDTAKLDAALSTAPDFSQSATTNTAELSRMMAVAPTLDVSERNRLMMAKTASWRAPTGSSPPGLNTSTVSIRLLRERHR